LRGPPVQDRLDASREGGRDLEGDIKINIEQIKDISIKVHLKNKL